MGFWSRRREAHADPDVETLAEAVEARWLSWPAGAMEMLGTVGEAPRDDEARAAWLRGVIARSFTAPTASTAYVVDADLRAAFDAHLRAPERLTSLAARPEGICRANELDALAMASRHHALSRGGAEAGARIAEEARILSAMADADVHARFSRSPRPRMDPVPTDPGRRHAWICETLRGEAAAIAAGRMSPSAVAHAASRSRLPVRHPRPEDGHAVAISFPAYHPANDQDDTVSAKARHAHGQEDGVLAERFLSVPGAGRPPAEPTARLGWCRSAVVASEIRRLPGVVLAEGSIPDIGIDGMRTQDLAGIMTAVADLVVDGVRICETTVSEDGQLTADHWEPGCGEADLHALDMILAAMLPLREDGSHETLATRVMDLVMRQGAVDAYRSASRDAVLFHEDDAILSVRIPQGGSREGAIAALAATRPGAVPLDHMEEGDAALLWITLA